MTELVHSKIQFGFFNIVFHVAPFLIRTKNLLRRRVQIGYYKMMSGIQFSCFPFNFTNHPSFLVPAGSLIREGIKYGIGFEVVLAKRFIKILFYLVSSLIKKVIGF